MPCDNTISIVPAVIQVTENITCVANRHFSVFSCILFDYLALRGFKSLDDTERVSGGLTSIWSLASTGCEGAWRAQNTNFYTNTCRGPRTAWHSIPVQSGGYYLPEPDRA